MRDKYSVDYIYNGYVINFSDDDDDDDDDEDSDGDGLPDDGNEFLTYHKITLFIKIYFKPFCTICYNCNILHFSPITQKRLPFHPIRQLIQLIQLS